MKTFVESNGDEGINFIFTYEESENTLCEYRVEWEKYIKL